MWKCQHHQVLRVMLSKDCFKLKKWQGVWITCMDEIYGRSFIWMYKGTWNALVVSYCDSKHWLEFSFKDQEKNPHRE